MQTPSKQPEISSMTDEEVEEMQNDISKLLLLIENNIYVIPSTSQAYNILP